MLRFLKDVNNLKTYMILKARLTLVHYRYDRPTIATRREAY